MICLFHTSRQMLYHIALTNRKKMHIWQITVESEKIAIQSNGYVQHCSGSRFLDFCCSYSLEPFGYYLLSMILANMCFVNQLFECGSDSSKKRQDFRLNNNWLYILYRNSPCMIWFSHTHTHLVLQIFLADLVAINRCLKHERFSCFKKYIAKIDTFYAERRGKCRLPLRNITYYVNLYH